MITIVIGGDQGNGKSLIARKITGNSRAVMNKKMLRTCVKLQGVDSILMDDDETFSPEEVKSFSEAAERLGVEKLIIVTNNIY